MKYAWHRDMTKEGRKSGEGRSGEGGKSSVVPNDAEREKTGEGRKEREGGETMHQRIAVYVSNHPFLCVFVH